LTFLVAGASSNADWVSGLGHLVVSRFGRSTLGLSYSIFLVERVIAPAFPSNTAPRRRVVSARRRSRGSRRRVAGEAGARGWAAT
jgi:di/tricarboxylate transporter